MIAFDVILDWIRDAFELRSDGEAYGLLCIAIITLVVFLLAATGRKVRP